MDFFRHFLAILIVIPSMFPLGITPGIHALISLGMLQEFSLEIALGISSEITQGIHWGASLEISIEITYMISSGISVGLRLIISWFMCSSRYLIRRSKRSYNSAVKCEIRHPTAISFLANRANHRHPPASGRFTHL